MNLGEALWAQGRIEHRDGTGAGDEVIQDAEVWLRKALDLAVDSGVPNNKLDAQVCTGYVCVCTYMDMSACDNM